MSIGEGYIGQCLDVREYLFTQVIDALEVVEFTNRQFAGIEQVRQNNFLFFPVQRLDKALSSHLPGDRRGRR
jgi:hypothetical protein